MMLFCSSDLQHGRLHYKFEIFQHIIRGYLLSAFSASNKMVSFIVFGIFQNKSIIWRVLRMYFSPIQTCLTTPKLPGPRDRLQGKFCNFTEMFICLNIIHQLKYSLHRKKYFVVLNYIISIVCICQNIRPHCFERYLPFLSHSQNYNHEPSSRFFCRNMQIRK